MDLQNLVNEIQNRHRTRNNSNALLIGISGIDGSGKGFITHKLKPALTRRGFKVANIGVVPWQNLPAIRMSETNSGAHFYHNGIRFYALFEQLLLPLKTERSATCDMDYMEQTAEHFSSYTYRFVDIDNVLVEGIFLFQSLWLQYIDMSIWIECSEKTALARAISRNQEGLTETDLIAEYQTIYFPAQRYHQEKDAP